MDDLERELGRLEETLTQADGPGAIIDELAAMRRQLVSGNGRAARLREVRVVSPCTARWADMGGADRVRVCDGCERPVFNLSEMTRDQADAVLATPGITPCVRFYRRTDGTVMTADAPSAKRTRRLTVVAAGTAFLGASPALAEPTAPEPDDAPIPATEPAAPDPDQEDATDELPHTPRRPIEWTMGVILDPMHRKPRSRIEWSTWVRAGYGIASRAPGLAARTTTPTPLLPEASPIMEGALGVDWTVSVAREGDVRVGAWAELRTTSSPVLGAELIVDGLPRRPYGGSGGLVLRGGGNGQVVTGAIGLGYTSVDSWPGFAHRPNTVRFVTSMTRGEREWSVTVGVELDPIGVLGFMLRPLRRD